MIWQLQFPSEGWTDVTHLVDESSIRLRRSVTNEARKPTVDSYRFDLQWDATIADKFASATEKVFFTATDDENGNEAIFTGWIAPTLQETTRDFPEALRLEALDMGYLLDEKATALVLPAAIGGTPLPILDTASPTSSIVGKILEAAGYDPAVRISSFCPDITDTVEQFVIEEDDGRTWKQILGKLLSEYRHVYYFNAAGLFSVYNWAPDSPTPVATVDDQFGTARGLRRTKRETKYDGFKAIWSRLAILDDVRLYKANLPVGIKADGSWGPIGEPIGAGGYFPPDSDVRDIYQRFDEQWLDVPYQRRGEEGGSRVQNKDISLILSDNHYVDFYGDTNVGIDLQEFESHRSRVRFQNTGSGTERLYTWVIKGRALYRESIEETSAPRGAGNPREVTTEFVFDSTTASNLASAWAQIYDHGDFVYTFEALDWHEPGTILRINPTGPGTPNIDTVVMVLEAEWSGAPGFARDGETFVRYKAQALTGFATELLDETAGLASVHAREQDTIARQLEEKPNWQDLGYTPAQVTTVPLPVTGVETQIAFGDITVSWKKQNDLSNLSHYEIQASESAEPNPALRYAPNRGDFWNGTAGTVQEVYGHEWTHKDIPYVGTSDNPSGRTVYYYIRAVTGQGDYSDWAGPFSETTYPVVAEDTVDFALNDRPQWESLGYDPDLVTQTPGSIANLYAQVAFDTVTIRWSEDPNLSDVAYYKVQVSEGAQSDPALRYSPDRGDFWNNAAGSEEYVYGTEFVHHAIPNAGTALSPSGRTLHYYVQTVNSNGDTGAWATVTATTYPIVEDDLSGNALFGGVQIAELSDVSGDLGQILAGQIEHDATLNFWDVDTGEMRVGDATSWMAFHDPGSGWRAELVNADLEINSAALATKEIYNGDVWRLSQEGLTLKWRNDDGGWPYDRASIDYDYVNERLDFAHFNGASLVDIFHLDEDGFHIVQQRTGLYYQKDTGAEERVRFGAEITDFTGVPSGMPAYNGVDIGADGLVFFSETDTERVHAAIDVNTGTLFLDGDIDMDGSITLEGSLSIQNATLEVATLPSGGHSGLRVTQPLHLGHIHSLSFDFGRHWITYNDGKGNFNFRIANYVAPDGNETLTEDGWAFHEQWGQGGSGSWQFNISDVSGVAGDAISWINVLFLRRDEIRFFGDLIVDTDRDINFPAYKGIYYFKGGHAEERVRFRKQYSDYNSHPSGMPNYWFVDIGADGGVGFTETDGETIAAFLDVNTGNLFLTGNLYADGRVYTDYIEERNAGAHIQFLDTVEFYGTAANTWYAAWPDGTAMLQRTSDRGGLAVLAHDDALILGAGDKGRYWSNYVSGTAEDVVLLADGNIRFFSNLQSGQYQWVFWSSGVADFPHTLNLRSHNYPQLQFHSDIDVLDPNDFWMIEGHAGDAHMKFLRRDDSSGGWIEFMRFKPVGSVGANGNEIDFLGGGAGSGVTMLSSGTLVANDISGQNVDLGGTLDVYGNATFQAASFGSSVTFNHSVFMEGGAKIDAIEGGYSQNSVPGDGNWHNIISNLSGNFAFMVIARFGTSGKHSMMVGFCTMSYGGGPAINRIDPLVSYYGNDYIQLRWDEDGTYDVDLQIRSTANVGTSIVYSIIRLLET